MNYCLRVKENGKKDEVYRTHSKRKIMSRLRTLKWENGPLKTCLSVSYGKRKDNFGKMVTFCNEGEYETKDDLWFAFNAFTEEE